MKNHLNGMKIAWDNLVSFHSSMFFALRLLDGLLNHFAERWWGYENCFYVQDGIRNFF